jgi:hypothetical protein
VEVGCFVEGGVVSKRSRKMVVKIGGDGIVRVQTVGLS